MTLVSLRSSSRRFFSGASSLSPASVTPKAGQVETGVEVDECGKIAWSPASVILCVAQTEVSEVLGWARVSSVPRP